jgi:hypothetical protein
VKLYHFCAPQFLDGIQENGLILGMTPLCGKQKQILWLRNTQWMTVNPLFEQSWNGMVSIHYDRTAYRLTYAIPKNERSHLLTWWELKARMQRKFGEGCILPGFDDDADANNWRIFLGRVKPGWLRAVKAKAENAAVLTR